MSEMLPLRDTDPREVGAYRLLGRLGEGGQGVVFLADSPSGTRAAVKLLPPTTDPQVRSRFLKEVAAAQRVARFCTAQILDAGIFERRPFIVSEYVDGPSLVEVVEQLGPRGGATLERIAVATLTALGAVHAVGMVHRDFKPANVLLGPDGPVVIDFGLATVPGMTTTGMSGQVAIGTPAFMAPEQLAGERVTAAADMWSWGVTIAFAGTGRLPFKGESLTATAYAILHSDPAVGTLPEPLGSLVHRCLTKDSVLRPSAREVLSELAAAGARTVGPMPPMVSARARAAPTEPKRGGEYGPTGLLSRWRPRLRGTGRAWWRSRAAALVTALVLIAGAGVLVYSLRGAPSGRPAVSQKLAAAAAARKRAVTWVLHQASPVAIVSCDALLCGDVANTGFPPANLVVLRPGSNGILRSDLVVATSDVRAQFHGRLAVYAPIVIASFGSGGAEIVIRRVFPGGAKRYNAVRHRALLARMTAGAQLLTNGNIILPLAAKAQLRSGDVDPRLPLLIAAMADARPVRIVDFRSQSPGGGPASLLRWVDLATAVPAAHKPRAAYVSWLRGFIRAQQGEYLPDWVQHVTLAHGQSVLRIGYGAPSPLR